MFGQAHGAVEHQCIGLAHWPNHCVHSVAAQLLQSCDALVAVDYQIAVCDGHHHDGRLLTGCGERSQQPTVPVVVARAEMLPAAVELMKLKSHSGFIAANLYSQAGTDHRVRQFLRGTGGQ